MADITLHMERVRKVEVAPYLKPEQQHPFAVVRLLEEIGYSGLHITPHSLERAREAAAALSAGCDVVEDAMKRAAAVPIESLAPDKTAA